MKKTERLKKECMCVKEGERERKKERKKKREKESEKEREREKRLKDLRVGECV